MRFGDYLGQAISKAGLSQRAFALQVKSHQQAINEIVKGKRTPPLARLDKWLDVLGTAVEREKFLELARLEHCPAEIQTLVAELRERLKRAEQNK